MPTATRFIGAPGVSAGEVPKKVAEMMQNPRYDSAWMITTISEELSLEPVAPGLRDIRFRRGKAEAIITTVAGGSGGENLHHAIKLIDEPYAILKPSAHLMGSFFYVAQGSELASVAIGPPGFYPKAGKDIRAHESVLLMDLDLSDGADAEILSGLRSHFDGLLAVPDRCRPLTPDLVPDLVANADEPVMPPKGRRATGEASGVEAFYKRLSKNDASWHDSPGQIIVPRDFVSFFDELPGGHDQSEGGGPRQRHGDLSLSFIDGKDRIEIDAARVILYVPAEDHPRKNPEMRFTFRSSEVLSRLSAGDYLEFRRGRDGRVVVERHDPDWSPPGETIAKRFGRIGER